MTEPGFAPSARTGPPRRILSVWLTRLALDRWRHAEGCRERKGADAAPLALIGETAHGPRIEAANRAALEAGTGPGMRLTDARAIHPGLKVAPSDPAGDAAFLERLALWARRWGPWSAVDAPDGLWVDVTGVAHLFGGEAALLADAEALLARRGLAARLAIAPTCGAAWALARYGSEGELMDLPVAALRLDEEVLLALRRLGLKRVGQLAEVGRAALKRRFRSRDPSANPLLRLDQLTGRTPEPLLPVVETIAPWVQRRLLEPIRHRELLDRVVADLAADMERALENRGEGGRRFELALWRIDGDLLLRGLEFAAASRDPAHLCRLLATRLDDVDAGFGIEIVRLTAPWTEALALEQGDIETDEANPGTTLAQCLDRLTVRLGKGAVCRPVPHASHIPERAQRWQPPLAPQPSSQGTLDFHGRPLKLLDKPEKIAVLYATPDGYPKSFRWRGQVHEVARVEGPERIAPEWWRERSSVRLRDYYRVEDSEGRRYWIYRHGLAGDGRGGVPDWFLQGLCA